MVIAPLAPLPWGFWSGWLLRGRQFQEPGECEECDFFISSAPVRPGYCRLDSYALKATPAVHASSWAVILWELHSLLVPAAPAVAGLGDASCFPFFFYDSKCVYIKYFTIIFY